MDVNHESTALESSEATANGSDSYCLALERLMHVVQELSRARSLEDVIAVVQHAARELTGADGTTLILSEGEMSYYVDENAIGPLWKGKRFHKERCIGGWAMSNREAVVIEDIYSDARIPSEIYRSTFVKSLIIAPIRKEDPIGAIGTYWARRYRPSPTVVRVLQTLADTTSVAMENVQLYAKLERRVLERTAELERSNEMLRGQAALLQQAHDAILVRNLKANDAIVYWNHGAEVTYGYTRQEALGKAPKELLKTRYPEAFERIERALFEEGHWNGELIHTTRSGEDIVVTSRWELQRDAGGAPNVILEINRDMTEKKKTEEALRESEKQLKRLSSQLLKAQENERKRIANEIHDSIGQSLHTIKTGLQNLFSHRRGTPKEVAESVESLTKSIDFAIEEVRNIYMGLRPSLSRKAP